MDSLEKTRKEYEEVLNQLSDPGLISDWEKFEELSKKKKKLEDIIKKQEEIEEIQKRIEESKGILKAGEDPELTTLAESELSQLQEKEEALKRELNENGHISESRSVIVEIRAGAGGDEATLFAGDLFKMYSKLATIEGWKQKTLNSHPTELGGLKEIIFELKPSSKKDDVFSKMKYEGGVHRVQRIPETEKSGRIHTSTATVAVLVKPGATDIKIKPDEIKIDLYKSSGPGGQNVNKRETAVRITHLPTGIVVSSQNERNQLQNKENALSILSARLLEKKQEEEEQKIGGRRKTQIGGAKRAEKIRTYNFPQNRITDHRIKKSWHDIESIMEGKMDKIIKDLQKNL